MNSSLLISAMLQTLVSLLISVTLLYAFYRLATTVLMKRYSSEPADNEALTVLSIGILFATGILLSASIIPIQNVTRIIQGNTLVTLLKYCLYFMMLGFCLIIGIVVATLWSFGKIAKIRQGLNENNIYIAILLCTIIVSLTLIAKESYITILERLIPYPKIPNYF